MTIVRIDQLEKNYGGVTVLSIDSVVLESGDRVAISGENGSGKSTLLKILAGLTRMSAGIEFRRKDWKSLSIGFLPQDGGVYRDLSVRENLAVAQRMLGVPPSEERSSFLADRFELKEVMNKRVELLSGGYRRLVGLFCLLSSGVDLLFMDEPFASLDPIKQRAIEDALKQQAKELELIVISEHVNNIPGPDQHSFWKKHIRLEPRNYGKTSQT